MSTMFLRGVVIALALIVLAICIFALPPAISSDTTGQYRPILIGMYVTALPFFAALYQAMKLLGYIDKQNAFSTLSVIALRRISHCAAVIAGLYAIGMPWIYHAANVDDAPGVIVIGLVMIGASLAIATFAAVLQRLLQSAIAIKSENDLTV